jgi:hypothetical protein
MRYSLLIKVVFYFSIFIFFKEKSIEDKYYNSYRSQVKSKQLINEFTFLR